MAEVQLKANCLGFTELLAQAIALISPTMTAALIMPVMSATIAIMVTLSMLIMPLIVSVISKGRRNRQTA